MTRQQKRKFREKCDKKCENSNCWDTLFGVRSEFCFDSGVNREQFQHNAFAPMLSVSAPNGFSVKLLRNYSTYLNTTTTL